MSEHLIWRNAGERVAGRIVVDGIHLRVELKLSPSDSDICIGFYEDLEQPAFLERKLSEIDSIFDDWARTALTLENPALVKASWVNGLQIPPEYRRANSETKGAVIVRHGDREIARIYKYKDHTGRWVES